MKAKEERAAKEREVVGGLEATVQKEEKEKEAMEAEWKEKKEKREEERKKEEEEREEEEKEEERRREEVKKVEREEGVREEAEKAPETLKLAAVFEKDPAGRIAAAGDILNQWKMEYRRML